MTRINETDWRENGLARKTEQTDRVKAGIICIMAVVILLWGVWELLPGMFQKRDEYFMYFNESVRGLSIGSDVEINGIPMGTVTDIALYSGKNPHLQGAVRVQIAMQPNTRIPTNSVARLEIKNYAAGNKCIQIEYKASTRFITPNSESRSQIQTLKSGLSLTIDKMNVLVDEISRVATSVKDLLENNEKSFSVMLTRMNDLMSRSSAAVDTAAQTVFTLGVKLGTSVDSVNELMYRNRPLLDESVTHLRETFRTLDELAKKLNDDPSLLLRGATPPNE